MSDFEKLNGAPSEDKSLKNSEADEPKKLSVEDDPKKLSVEDPKKLSVEDDPKNLSVEDELEKTSEFNGATTEDKSLKDSKVDDPKKLSVESELKKTLEVVGESKKDEIQKTSDEGATMTSSEKRKPRLNRRSFHLINNPIADLSTEKSKPVAATKKITGSEKIKVVIPQKKIISLASFKKSSIEINPAKESKVISLKRASSTTDVKNVVKTSKVSETSEQPPPKKHKPITWP